jgi:hypothetical protein
MTVLMCNRRNTKNEHITGSLTETIFRPRGSVYPEIDRETSCGYLRAEFQFRKSQKILMSITKGYCSQFEWPTWRLDKTRVGGGKRDRRQNNDSGDLFHNHWVTFSMWMRDFCKFCNWGNIWSSEVVHDHRVTVTMWNWRHVLSNRLDVRDSIATWLVFLFLHFPGTGRATVAPKLWFDSFEVGDDDSGLNDRKILRCDT